MRPITVRKSNWSPVYTTENVWHGSCELGTGTKLRAQQTLFTLHHFYRSKNTVPTFLGPHNFSWRHAQFNYNQERPQPRSQGLLRFQDGGAKKTLAHTVIPPAKYCTNRGVFCHVTHTRISFSLHLISGSKNQKWLRMSEDLASIWLHFACFSCKIGFLWTVEFPNTFIVISTTWTCVV